MSTKKIEQALHAASMSIPTELYDEALGELEAIRKACRDFSSGTECGEVITSEADDAVELFEAIAEESK